MAKVSEQIETVVGSAVAAVGYELVGAELAGPPRAPLLRVYIDAPAGVTVDDCARASHQIGGALEVENIFAGRYILEVSSPGLDRPLFRAADYARFAGEEARIRLRLPLEGRRQLTGRIGAVHEDAVEIVEAERTWLLRLDDIAGARLKPKF